MQLPLAQAVVAAGGVEDVGLELGAGGVVAGVEHGGCGGGTCPLIAPHRERL